MPDILYLTFYKYDFEKSKEAVKTYTVLNLMRFIKLLLYIYI